MYVRWCTRVHRFGWPTCHTGYALASLIGNNLILGRDHVFFFCVHLCLLFEHSYKQRDWVKYVTEVKLGFFISMFWCLSFRFFNLSFVTCRKHALLHRSPRYDRLKCWSPLGVSSCAHPPFRSHPSLLKQPLLTGIQLSYFSLLWRKVCILQLPQNQHANSEFAIR